MDKTKLGQRRPGSSPEAVSTRGVPGADCAHLGDVREANKVGDHTDGSNEELPAIAEKSGVLIHQGRDEALHGAELQKGMEISSCSRPQSQPT